MNSVKKQPVIMKGCILMNRIKSFCRGVDQINSLLIKKNIEILCQSMTFSVLELLRGYIYQLYQNGLEFRQKVIGAFFVVIFTTMDLSLAVSHVSECPSSGTRGVRSFFIRRSNARALKFWGQAELTKIIGSKMFWTPSLNP